MPTVSHGGGYVHVWAGIYYEGLTSLVTLRQNVNAETYKRALETEMVPYARKHFGLNFFLCTTIHWPVVLGEQKNTRKGRKFKRCPGQHLPPI
jgi:hypothetical protein